MVVLNSQVRTITEAPRRAIWLPLIGVCSALLFCSPRVHAETVAFAGVQFPVDSREELPDGSVKVVIQERPYLFSRGGMEREVALTYLADSALSSRLSAQQLRALVTHGSEESEPAFVDRVVIAAANSRSMSPEATVEFFRLVESRPGGEGAVGRALTAIGSAVREQSLCLGLPHLQKEILVSFSSVLRTAGFRASCSRLLKEQALASLRQGDVSTTERIVTAMADLGADERSLSAEVVKASQKLQQLSRALQQGAHAEIVTTLGSIRSDAFFSEVSVASLPAIILKAAEASLSQAKPVGALYLLAHTDLTARTPQHHALVSRSLAALSRDQVAEIAKDPIRSGLRLYATKDDLIRSSLVTLLGRTAEQLASGGRASDAEQMRELISFMSLVRPDPSAQNDEVRARCAAALARTENAAYAKILLSEIETGIPFALRLSLLTWQSIVVLVVIAVVLVVVALSLFSENFRRAFMVRTGQRVATARPSGKAAVSDLPSHEGDDDIGRTFVAYPPEFRSSGRRGEIEGLLSSFGLPPDASLKEIKNAYRNSVKAVHPDRNLLSPDLQSDAFIDLTKKYERLLELLESQPKGD